MDLNNMEIDEFMPHSEQYFWLKIKEIKTLEKIILDKINEHNFIKVKYKTINEFYNVYKKIEDEQETCI